MNQLLQQSPKDLCNPTLRKSWNLKDVEKLIAQTKNPLIRGAANKGNAFLSYGNIDNWDAIWGKDSDKKIEDCTTYANTTEGDASYPTGSTSKLRLNPTTDVIDTVNNVSSNDVALYRNLGSALSDTAWVQRQKIDYSALVANGTAAQAHDTSIGMSDVSTSPTNNHDFLGFVIQGRSTGFTFICASFIAKSLGSAPSASSSFATTPSTSSPYYLQNSRLSATSFKSELFSNSVYSTSIEAETLTVSSLINSLQYWYDGIFSQTVSGGGDITQTIDDMRSADGVTTPP